MQSRNIGTASVSDPLSLRLRGRASLGIQLAASEAHQDQSRETSDGECEDRAQNSETFDLGTDASSLVANDYFDESPFEFSGALKCLYFKNL